MSVVIIKSTICQIRTEEFPLDLSMNSHWLSGGSQRFGLKLTAVRIANFLMNFLLKVKVVNNQVGSLRSNLEKKTHFNNHYFREIM